MSNQTKTLKERLEQRKNKKLLSTSDCTEAIETIKNHRMGKNENNKSQIINPGDTSPSFNFKALMGEDYKFELDNSFDKLNLDKDEKIISSNISPNESYINADNKLGTKHKMIVNNMNSSVSNFLEDFSFLFFEQIFQKFYKEIGQINEEKYQQKFEIYQKFQCQIAEMELMMRDDDSHAENIKVIIDNLKEDKEAELKCLEDKFSKILDEKLQMFKNHNMNNSPALQTIQEKFKIDMLNIVNDIIYPKLK